MKKKLIVRDEAKQHLKKMYDILGAKILDNEQLVKTTAGVEPCGAYCMVTCAYFCRPSCEIQCRGNCDQTCETGCKLGAVSVNCPSYVIWVI